MLGVDYVKVVPPYDNVCKGNGVRDVLVFVLINSRGCNKAPIDYVRNEPDDVLIIETPEVVAVSTEDKLDADYVIYGLVGTLRSSFD